ncbi:fibronectin type III domain-containing protein [Dyadobacter jiangsuensis]|uniref:Putative secreted protein (Por secretion system target) n=1 Tax=Dyadobacter jiangsuensis TaxID=1591085 RepID=A0A2P8G8F9_9BACT|nr:fibronectin type III domain-containing protein [Dyadobacter jiangsuensis]PSL30269.1 putative secreted protein (Por secretion system target) [Dyadobacter jiangsuensis]
MNRTFTRHAFSSLTLFCIILLLPWRVLGAIPKAPTTLVAVAASGSQINLGWLDLATDETGFEVEQSTDGTKFVKVADLAANTVTYQDKSLKSATKYWYRVRAKNASGASAYSNVANATTLVIITIPKAPTTLVANAASSTQINLNWTDNANDETGFELERSTDALAFTKIADLGPNVTSYQHTGLAPATRYWYRVLAKNTAGKSVYSNIANATTQEVAPNAPTNLTAVPTAPDLIQLRWAKPAANATEIVIERAKGEGNFAPIAKVGATILQYEDRAELETADYFYRIKAVNAGGASPYSLLAIVRAASIITAVENPQDQHLIYLAGRTLVVDINRATGAKVSVYDLSGRAHFVKQITQEGRIDLTHLAAGIYVVVTDTGKEVISKRIFLY